MCSLKCILIVDDDPILRVIAHSFFENLGGFEVLQAANGRGALDLIEQRGHEIEFILCDLNMPEFDGVQLLRKLKDHEFSGAICILSGEDQRIVETAHRLANSLGLTIVGALQKPLNMSDLNQLVTSIPVKTPAQEPLPAVTVSADDIRNALIAGQIIPFYQPKVDVATGRIVGAEALARWIRPQFGIVSPDDFIPVAEHTGLIDFLTDVIIQSVLEDLKRWRGQGLSINIAINIAAELLSDLDFPDRLSAKIDAAGLCPSDFVFEVTESSVLQGSSDPLEVLTRLRIKGFGLAIDDFGTGHSNIDQLKKFPFSELKIDRSFVQGARNDSLSRAIVDAAVMLGRELNMRLVAEGVETPDDWNFVAEHGIDEVQG
ncbi:MAG: EAL domain-containing response regulator, partial [Aestuariivirgaceae bacterium]